MQTLYELLNQRDIQVFLVTMAFCTAVHLIANSKEKGVNHG